jgi:hypothetical protein
LGGDYWKEALLTEGLLTKQREEMIVKGYITKLSENGYLEYTGYCPIQATRESRTKYYMIFASPHPDAMLLLNDAMLKSFEEFMTEAEFSDTLFSDLSWTDWCNTQEIKRIAPELSLQAVRLGALFKFAWFNSCRTSESPKRSNM